MVWYDMVYGMCNSESKTRNQQRDYYEKKEEMALRLQEQKQLEAMRIADCIVTIHT